MPILGAVVVAFFAVAVPVILLMTVWATVTALRILFPEQSLPLDPSDRRPETGEGVPVRLHDILVREQARRARAPKTPIEGDRDPAASGPRPHPFVEDLWLRRN